MKHKIKLWDFQGKLVETGVYSSIDKLMQDGYKLLAKGTGVAFHAYPEGTTDGIYIGRSDDVRRMRFTVASLTDRAVSLTAESLYRSKFRLEESA